MADVVREEMTSFWQEHSLTASEEEMMLDSDAEKLGQLEIPELLSLIPDIHDTDVLELGAGIGRYTEHFAKSANHVTAVDFMQKFVEANKIKNGHYNNVKFVQCDVTQLEQNQESYNPCWTLDLLKSVQAAVEPEGYDLVFSNWLMMYMSDTEVELLLRNVLSWLRGGQYFFFRESCFHQSGNKKRTANPTQYRDPSKYGSFLHGVSVQADGEQHCYGFDVVLSRSVQTYIELKSNRNQVCWLVQKVKRPLQEGHHGYRTFQEFLDEQQYSRSGILRYERIFGKHYVSTGGKETTEEFVRRLGLRPGQRVLDVGAGIGGSAFLMAQEYGVHVTGIDLSTNMISIAMERANEVAHENEQAVGRVQFEVADATKREYADGSFDVVYSRDTILHIADKQALFDRFYRWLRPGGQVLITDYCCSDGVHSSQFTSYVKQRGYNLLSPTQYGKVLEKSGFVDVMAEDKTNMFVDTLKTELQRFEEMKEDFIQEFSQADYDAIANGWNDKVVRCGQGDQRWGLFHARKGAAPTRHLQN